MPLKRKLIFLIVAVALAAGAAGAYAATQTSRAASRQAFLNDVAHRLHVTPTQLKKAVDGALADRLSAMVASGRLSKAQANAIKQRLKSARGIPGARLIAPGFFPPGPRFFGRFFGPAARKALSAGKAMPPGWYGYVPAVPPPPGVKVPGAPKARRAVPVPPAAPAPPAGVQAVPVPVRPGFGLIGLGMFPTAVKATTSYLGISLAKLQSELGPGKSLAKIASARGKTAGGLESAIKSAINARLDRLVAKKRLTSAQAKKISSALDARVASIVHASPLRVAKRLYKLRARRLGLPPAFP